MKYIIKYLPNGVPITDGSTVIDSSGSAFIYDEQIHEGIIGNLRSAELFIVKTEYNEDKIVGKPSPAALQWLKPGMELKMGGCEIWWYDPKNRAYPEGSKIAKENEGRVFIGGMYQVVRVTCDMCGHQH